MVLILSLFGALVAAFATNVPPTLKATVLAILAWIAATFYLFILVTSNPFLRRGDLLSFHPGDVESVPAARTGAVRGTRP